MAELPVVSEDVRKRRKLRRKFREEYRERREKRRKIHKKILLHSKKESRSIETWLYWSKLPLSVMSALIGICLKVVGAPYNARLGLLFGFCLLIPYMFVMTKLLNLDADTMHELGGRRQIIWNGLPSYVLLWIFIWAILYLVIFPVGVS